MKTRFYKLSLPFLLIAVLASCMKSETEPVSMPVSGEADLEFSYSVPDYTVVRTKSAESTVNDISLLQFDADGRFLGRSVASDLQGGTFKAKVSGSTRIVHSQLRLERVRRAGLARQRRENPRAGSRIGYLGAVGPQDRR